MPETQAFKGKFLRAFGYAHVSRHPYLHAVHNNISYLLQLTSKVFHKNKKNIKFFFTLFIFEKDVTKSNSIDRTHSLTHTSKTFQIFKNKNKKKYRYVNQCVRNILNSEHIPQTQFETITQHKHQYTNQITKKRNRTEWSRVWLGLCPSDAMASRRHPCVPTTYKVLLRCIGWT